MYGHNLFFNTVTISKFSQIQKMPCINYKYLICLNLDRVYRSFGSNFKNMGSRWDTFQLTSTYCVYVQDTKNICQYKEIKVKFKPYQSYDFIAVIIPTYLLDFTTKAKTSSATVQNVFIDISFSFDLQKQYHKFIHVENFMLRGKSVMCLYYRRKINLYDSLVCSNIIVIFI